MVSAAGRLVLIVTLVLSGRVPAKEPGDYHVGDTVEADIVTPVALHVVDAETDRNRAYAERIGMELNRASASPFQPE